MPDLRDRLRASDPLLEIRPLDEAEIAAMRRAMRAAAPPRSTATWKPAAGLAVAAAALAVAVLAWRPGGEPEEVPVVHALPTPAGAVPVPAVARAPESSPAPAPAAPAWRAPSREPRVREVRFVTASGTQIVWTFRSPEEGA